MSRRRGVRLIVLLGAGSAVIATPNETQLTNLVSGAAVRRFQADLPADYHVIHCSANPFDQLESAIPLLGRFIMSTIDVVVKQLGLDGLLSFPGFEKISETFQCLLGGITGGLPVELGFEDDYDEEGDDSNSDDGGGGPLVDRGGDEEMSFQECLFQQRLQDQVADAIVSVFRRMPIGMIIDKVPIIDTIVEDTIHTIVEESVLDILFGLNKSSTGLDSVQYVVWKTRVMYRRDQIEQHKARMVNYLITDQPTLRRRSKISNDDNVRSWLFSDEMHRIVDGPRPELDSSSKVKGFGDIFCDVLSSSISTSEIFGDLVGCVAYSLLGFQFVCRPPIPVICDDSYVQTEQEKSDSVTIPMEPCDVTEEAQDPTDPDLVITLQKTVPSNKHLSIEEGNDHYWIFRAIEIFRVFADQQFPCSKPMDPPTPLPGWTNKLIIVFEDIDKHVRLPMLRKTTPISTLLKRGDSCDFLVLIRETVTQFDRQLDLADHLEPFKDVGNAHAGYLKLGIKIQDIILDFLNTTEPDCLNQDDTTWISVAGYSLGGAVAKIVTLGLSLDLPQIKFSLVTFGSPGSLDKAAYNALQSRASVRNWVYEEDFVPNFPCPQTKGFTDICNFDYDDGSSTHGGGGGAPVDHYYVDNNHVLEIGKHDLRQASGSPPYSISSFMAFLQSPGKRIGANHVYTYPCWLATQYCSLSNRWSCDQAP